MSIPQCFDNLLGAKPKHPRVGELSAAPPLPVEEVAPMHQTPSLNLTQFNNIGNFRPNVAVHIPRRSTRACRAKNLFQLTNQLKVPQHQGQLFNTRHELSNVIPSSSPLYHFHTFNRCQELNCNSSPHPHKTLLKDH